jgi:hypothetical protein
MVGVHDALTHTPPCDGFTYRGYCRHVDAVVDLLRQERLVLAQTAVGSIKVDRPGRRIEEEDAWVLDYAPGAA